MKLLIVEDDAGLAKQLKWSLAAWDVITAQSRAEAIAQLRRHEPAVVLQDLGLPPDEAGVTEGLETLRETLALAPSTKVIVMTGNDERENAIKAVALGAWDFYQKPIDVEVLTIIVRRAFAMHALETENRMLQARHGQAPLDGVIAISDSMRRVCRMVEKVAPTSATVLLLGESGTGKEVLGRAVHGLSTRADKPFIAINCAAIPENLLESELFGYERGAFTGAAKQTRGKIEYADKGTLFLDEIGDMPLALQAKMLRFLQERVIERIGGRETIPVDVRVVCATNRNLKEAIASAAFREDLYYRISEVVVQIPPLREREGDAVVIGQHLLEKRAAHHGRKIRGFEPAALRAIEEYAWPGNIRELENRVNGAVIMADGALISALDLGLESREADLEFLNLRLARQNAEQHAVRRALALADNNLSRAAELLGVTRPTLYDLLERNDLRPKEES